MKNTEELRGFAPSLHNHRAIAANRIRNTMLEGINIGGFALLIWIALHLWL